MESKFMSTGYCPSCKEQVLLKREDMDIGLLIILFIFTAGIGALIYAIIHLSKEENRCVHCNSVVERYLPKAQSYSNKKLVYQVNGNRYNNGSQTESALIETKTKDSEKANFCPNCGVELANRNKALFCPYCGSSTQ